MPLESKSGTIAALCTSPNHGYPTYLQESVIVGPLGIEGDAHSGPLRESFTKPGTMKPNDRPISIVADEVREEMNTRFGLDIQPGGFNEQILVRGFGDLSDVKIGDRVTFDTGVELEVTDNAYPCKKLTDYHGEPELMKALLIEQEGKKALSRRGILTRVINTGELQLGDTVTLFKYIDQNET